MNVSPGMIPKPRELMTSAVQELSALFRVGNEPNRAGHSVMLACKSMPSSIWRLPVNEEKSEGAGAPRDFRISGSLAGARSAKQGVVAYAL